MECCRRIIKQTSLLWSLLLSLSLLCAQGVGLHVHSLENGHDDLNHVHAADLFDSHSYMGKAHLVLDTSHSDHHDSSVSEIDIKPDGVLKKAGNNIFAIALIVFLVTFLVFTSSRQLIFHQREIKLVLRKYYTLSPPLRAPPQY